MLNTNTNKGSYMTITGIIAAILIACASPFYQSKKIVRTRPLEPKQCKAIVFDLGGVVLDTCAQKTAWEIGPKLLLNHWLSSQKTSDLFRLRPRLYALLNAAHNQQEGNEWGIKDGEGKIVPQLMAEWLRGMRPNRELLTQVKQFSETNPAWFAHPAERQTLMRVSHLIFDPKRFIKTRKLFDQSASLIRECKKRGFKLYVLSNWDRDSGKLLVEKYPDLFGLFDGIVFSGDVQAAKPEPEIFAHITQEIPAQECVFIDDQPENISAAEHLGFNTILVHNQGSQPDINAVRKQLQVITPLLSAHNQILGN